MLEVTALDVRFQAASAVRGVSLSVAAGEIVALVGGSGGGKSTILRALAGLCPPEAAVSGRATLGGVDILGLDAEGRRRILRDRLGVVFQEPGEALNPVRSVRWQVEESVDPERRRPRAERRRAAEARLAAAGLPRVGRVYPHELSGGMRQRVGIAMATARDPALLLADEPAAHLDPPLRAEVLGRLLAPAEDRGVLWVTHDLAEAFARADRIYVLQAGAVVEAGPAREVLTRPGHPYTAALVAALAA